jgi:hypothetical protein
MKREKTIRTIRIRQTKDKLVTQTIATRMITISARIITMEAATKQE